MRRTTVELIESHTACTACSSREAQCRKKYFGLSANRWPYHDPNAQIRSDRGTTTLTRARTAANARSPSRVTSLTTRRSGRGIMIELWPAGGGELLPHLAIG